MNGGHDLGGMHGLGPIAAEPERAEPVFHDAWERRVFALTLATAALGRWNIDMSRHARERQHPAVYLSHSYYENWLAGLERLLVEGGLVDREELETARASGAADEDLRRRVPNAQALLDLAARNVSYEVPVEQPPRFQPGDRVRAINRHPSGHTREPRYVRGRTGTIETHHGAHVFPDHNAAGVRAGRHLYGVRFDARELWGDEAEPSVIFVDLFEEYLDPAG